jgi:predicted RNase H-like nuclease (RuvC/YqgF family)
MTASAAEKPAIWVNERGNVEMSKETFMNREKDLLRLEAKVQVLERALEEEREATDEYIRRVKELERLLNEQNKLTQRLEFTNAVKYGLVGIVVGGLIAVIAD